MSFTWLTLPLNRKPNGDPTRNHVRPVNRSDVIRDIYRKFGIETNSDVVMNEMIKAGLP
jgi:hypothetical protein